MLKSLAIRLARKYAVSAVRDAVAANKDDVSLWAERVSVWSLKLQMALSFVNVLAKRLEDGVLTAEEAEATIGGAQTLAAEITKKQ